jgi:hypothetical protein
MDVPRGIVKIRGNTGDAAAAIGVAFHKNLEHL